MTKNLCRKCVDHGTKWPKWLKLSPNKNGLSRWSFIPYNMKKSAAISLMGACWHHNQISKSILIFLNSSEMTSEATISLMGRCWQPFKIQKCFLILLNLTNLYQEQKLAQILYPSTYYIYYSTNRILLMGQMWLCICLPAWVRFSSNRLK